MRAQHENLLKNIFYRFGIQVRRTKNALPVDLTNAEDIDPVSAAYIARGRPALFFVPIDRVLTFGYTGFTIGPDSNNPFVRTLSACKETLRVKYDESPLKVFYSLYQPASVKDILGLENPSFTSFDTLPPEAAPKLWLDEQPGQLSPVRSKQVESENREHGLNENDTAGDPFFGPVTRPKGEFELKRIIRIYQSIKNRGLKIDWNGINNIRVVALVAKSDWRIMIAHSGQHRAAALAALGYREIPVQLQSTTGCGGLVSRCQVDSWPSVRNRYFMKNEALQVFDRIFQGIPPNSARAWLQHNQTYTH